MDIIFWDILILEQIFFSRQVKRSVIISNKYGICELPHKLPNELCNTWISELNTKRLYTTTTQLTHISNIIITKNQETGFNTNHDHTHTYMENKQQTIIRWHKIPTTNTIINIKNELKTIIQIHYRQHALNNLLDEFKTNFCINNALCKLTNESLTLLL